MTDAAKTPSIFGIFPDLPPREALDAAMASVSIESRLAFQNELLDGLYDASTIGELGPLARSVRAWYRSAVQAGRADFQRRVSEAREDLTGLLGHEP